MEITRARTQAAHAVCATRLSVARTHIHAIPAAAANSEEAASVPARTRPMEAPAKIRVAQATTPSCEMLRRARASTPAPPRAPKPKQAKTTPYPSAPKRLAISATNAPKALANSDNARLRPLTARILGA